MLLYLLPFALFQGVAIAKNAHSVIRRYTVEEAMRDPSNLLAQRHLLESQLVSPDYVVSLSAYWISDVSYSGSTCDAWDVASLIMSFSLSTGFCYRLGPDYSQKFSCLSAIQCSVSYFAGHGCTGAEIFDSPLSLSLYTCAPTSADDDGMVIGESTTYAAQMLSVSQGFPPEAFSGDSGIMSVYAAEECDESATISYLKFYQNHCYNYYYNTTDFYSERWTATDYYLYIGEPGCNEADLDDTYGLNVCVEATNTTRAHFVATYSSDEDKDYTNVIIGAVVGGGGGLLLIAGLVYYFMFYGKGGAPSPQAVSQTEMVPA